MSSEIPLATPEEIRAIFRRANELIDLSYDKAFQKSLPPKELQRLDDRFRPALEALRFCCVAAEQLEDASLLPLVAEAIDICDLYEDSADDDRTAMAEAVTWLLYAGLPVDESVRELATAKDARLRSAVAKGLSPRGEAEVELLSALAADSVPGIRNAARKALAPVREVAWWKGKLSRDPELLLGGELSPALRHTLGKISEILDEPSYRARKSEPELSKLVALLPDELAVDLVETIHASIDVYGTRRDTLLALMLARPGGVRALERLFLRWAAVPDAMSRNLAIVKVVEGLPLEARAAVCEELLADAAALSDEQRWEGYGSAAHLMATVAAKAWPPGADLAPLLDAVLALPSAPGNKLDWVRSAIREALEAEGADPASILDRIIEARLAGYPGAYGSLSQVLDRLLARVPGAAIREAAQRAIRSEDDGTVRWGLEQLLRGAFAPDQDGSRVELARRLLAEPRYRGIIFGASSLREVFLPALREELRRGALERAQTEAVIVTIGTIFGGVAVCDLGMRPVEGRESELLEDRRKKVAALGEALGPSELRGPPTDEEWGVLRALQARWAENHFEPRSRMDQVLTVFRDGPWRAEDRALVDAAFRLYRENAADDAYYLFGASIAAVLASKPDAEGLEMVNEIIRISPPGPQGLMKLHRRDIRVALGLPEIPPRVTAKVIEKSAPSEWMDEPEDNAE